MVKSKSAFLLLARVILSTMKRWAKVSRAYLETVAVRSARFEHPKVAFATYLISLSYLVGTIGWMVTFGGIDRGGKK